MRGRRPLPLTACLAAVLACTEHPLTNVDPGTAPGSGTETFELLIPVTDLPFWRDTTYSGFALPSTSPFLVVSNDPALQARSLVRFNVPDTIRTFADTLPADRFESADFRVQLDTLRSEFGGFPVTLRLAQLGRGFDVDSASWDHAAPGVPWSVPGGDLGVTVASTEIAAAGDSVILEPALPVDSLLKAWQDSDGEPGLALVVEGPGARLRVQQVVLRFEVVLEGREVPISQSLAPNPSTFITDPALPPTGTALRLGGLPAARMYVAFRLPSNVAGISLENATVNYAELIFHPLAAPPAPFSLERPIAARPVPLLADPFDLGPKTPIGASPSGSRALAPDSLATGRPVPIDVTTLVATAVRSGDAGLEIRLGLRADPDAQTLGFWEFGSIESAAAVRPQLLLIVSPSPEFDVP